MTKRFFEQGAAKHSERMREAGSSRFPSLQPFPRFSMRSVRRTIARLPAQVVPARWPRPSRRLTEHPQTNSRQSVQRRRAVRFSLLRDRPIPAAAANLSSSRSPERWRIHIRPKPRATLPAGSASRSRHPLLEAGAVREIVISTPQGLRWFRRCSALSASEPLRAPDFESADYRSLPQCLSHEFDQIALSLALFRADRRM